MTIAREQKSQRIVHQKKETKKKLKADDIMSTYAL